MTDFLEETHAQILFTLLDANPFMTLAPPVVGLIGVWDGVVPNHPTPDPPYVLVYSTVAFPRDAVGTSLDAIQSTVHTEWTCHCVGLDAIAARAVHMQVRSTLLNVRPVIAGRVCSLIKDTGAGEASPVKDESTGRLVFDMVSAYDFYSTG